MSVIYRIRGWDEHFENNRTRELKHLAWVPMPVKHDGDGYTELLDHRDGVAHFGAWCLIVEVAAKCDPRGTLLRDGAVPHTEDTLARVTRAPAKVFAAVLPRLVSIGWLEACAISQEGAVIPQEGAALLKGTEGKEQKGTERKPRTVVRADVDAVLAHYKHFHPTARPKEPSRKLVGARLQDGYTVADLQAAIDGNHRSPFHCGENKNGSKYHKLTLILRDSEHVQQFMEVPLITPHESEMSAARGADNWLRMKADQDRQAGGHIES